MKASELRIGNCVKQGTIESLSTTLAEVNDCVYEVRVLESIPLTEEWLIKFGFKNIDTNEDGGDNYWYLDKTDFMLDRSFQSLQMNTSFDLKYIHQLQNLHFALTGVELELSSNVA